MASDAVKGLLTQISKANVSGGGNYFRDGRYLCMLKSMEVKQLFKTGLTFIADLIVLEAAPITEGETPNAVGSTVSFFQGYLDSTNKMQKDMSSGHIKDFVLRLCDEPDFPAEDIKANEAFTENLDNALGKDNPLRGTRVRVETFRKRTKDGSKVLTLPKFISVPDQDGDACRAAYDALVK
jgi:hypothetical protein